MLSSATAFPASTSPAHRYNVQFRLYRSLVNSCADLACLSFADSNVAVPVSDRDYGPESRPFASVSLLLDKPDSQDLLLDIRQESVNNLRLFDSHSLREYFFH